jgi:hypothetical protein
MSGYAHVRNGSFATFRLDADHFRSSPISRHFQSKLACLKGANSRTMRARTRYHKSPCMTQAGRIEIGGIASCADPLQTASGRRLCPASV